MKKFNFILITSLFLLVGCSIYGPLSDIKVREVPAGTKSVIVNADLQKVKEVFVDDGLIVNQNSDNEFKTEPLEFPAYTSYYQAMNHQDKVKVIAVGWQTLTEFQKKERVVRETNDPKALSRRIFSKVVNICEANNLEYELSD
jgi:hypothetical protein